MIKNKNTPIINVQKTNDKIIKLALVQKAQCPSTEEFQNDSNNSNNNTVNIYQVVF